MQEKTIIWGKEDKFFNIANGRIKPYLYSSNSFVTFRCETKVIGIQRLSFINLLLEFNSLVLIISFQHSPLSLVLSLS